MISENQIAHLSGTTVNDIDGNKIGKAGQVYLDDSTGRPAWLTVNTGLFGTSESFVPIEDATFTGDSVTVNYAKDRVKDAPKVDADAHLDADEERELYRYYGLQGHGGSQDGDDLDLTSRNHRDSADLETTGRESVGHDTSGRTTDDAMTRSEERLEVGTERVQTGKARLRKFVSTEEQTVTVPVQREEVRLEREPITDANVGDALDGPAISEEEHEVVLTEERPVVSKEAVPVERVRLDTETVTSRETVSDEVRKENIDLDTDATVRRENR